MNEIERIRRLERMVVFLLYNVPLNPEVFDDPGNFRNDFVGIKNDLMGETDPGRLETEGPEGGTMKYFKVTLKTTEFAEGIIWASDEAEVRKLVESGKAVCFKRMPCPADPPHSPEWSVFQVEEMPSLINKA